MANTKSILDAGSFRKLHIDLILQAVINSDYLMIIMIMIIIPHPHSNAILFMTMWDFSDNLQNLHGDLYGSLFHSRVTT